MRFTIFDRWGNPLGDIPDVISANRVRATDATDTLDVTCLGEINKDERIVFADSMGRWCEYVCQGSETKRASGIPVTVAYCAGSIAELSRSYIEDKRNRDADAKACLVKALDGTRWEAGTVDLGTTLQSADLSFYHCTVLEAIQNIADTYGLEIETEYQPTDDGNAIGRRIIHMLDRRGQTNPSRRFEYGKDLTEISRDVDSADVITRLYGWGKGVETTDESGNATGGYGRKIDFSTVNNGKKYVEDATATKNWGIPGPDGTRQPSVGDADFTDCDDPTELLALTKAQLKTLSTPVVSYEATVAALQKAGMGVEGVDVGDEVQIVDTAFAAPLRLEGRVLKIDEDLVGSLADTKITLGNIRQTYTQRLSAQQQQLDKLVSSSGAWNDAASGTGPYMRDLIDRINEIMNATGGYAYMKPGIGIMVYDKPEDQNPTQAIQIGGGFWRIADKKKPNGDWDFRSLANGHGIFADTLFTGRLSDAAGLNYWDMDTGEFSLSARSTVGGKTVQEYADGALADANSYTDAAKQAAITEAKRQADAADTTKLAEAKKYAETKASEAETAAKAQSKTDSEAAKAAAQAYVDALDESLGQRSIFDRLTNNGKTQGIYLSGGLLYLNATYMKTGVLDAALVRAGRLTDKKGLNYWDMDTGEFSLSANSTINGNKASSLATQTQAQKLATDAQTAAKAYADSITTYNGGNLVRNPNGDPSTDLDKLGSSRLTNSIPSHPEGVTTGIHLTVRDTNFGWTLDNFRNRTFALSGWAYRKAGNVTSSFGIYWVDTSGTNHRQNIATASASASGWVYVTGRYTVPSNAKSARLWMQVNMTSSSSPAPDWYWTGLQCTDETAITEFVNSTASDVTTALKAYANSGDTSTLEAAKSYADNTATSHVNTFEKALTQQYIFNKLTNNGQLQGLYMSGGLLYVNATYLRSGIISGARSYWNLDSGIFGMSDANGVETVHLDGNGGHNTLTGTFQTGTSGSRLWMSPKFKQKPIGGTSDITGAGISFIHATDAAQQPYIAAESTNSELGEISTLTFNGGRRANTDPGAFVRVGSTKTDNAKMRGVFQALVMRDYSLSSNDAKSSGARLVSSASPDTNAMDTYSELAAWDPNGAVGVKADINTGYLYMGGFLGGYANRHTLDGSMSWKAWMPNGGAISVGAAATVHFTASSPAKYGRYYAVANADGEWGGIIMHVKNTGGQSGWDILMYNADRNPCTVDMYCDTFGWLVK